MKQIAIYGASGHGKVVADIARSNGYDDILFIDDGIDTCLSFTDFVKTMTQVPVALGVGDAYTRARLYQACLDHGLHVETLIHPSAVLSSSVAVGEGTVIMAGVVVNTMTQIGKGCILNTSCVIEHDNHIGDFVHIAPNVACAGDVSIGSYAHIGIGSCVIQGLSIGEKSFIGAGSVVVSSINAHTLAYGNPCKAVKELNT
jgi:UDP-N-acetylbacillosamine N-acetyltransferase